MKTERNPLESGEKIGIRGVIYNNSAVFSPTGATACRLLKRGPLCAKVPEVRSSPLPEMNAPACREKGCGADIVKKRPGLTVRDA